MKKLLCRRGRKNGWGWLLVFFRGGRDSLVGLSDEAKVFLSEMERDAVAALGRGEEMAVSAAMIVALIEIAKATDKAKYFVEWGVDDGYGTESMDWGEYAEAIWVDWKERDEVRKELEVVFSLLEGAVWGEGRE